MSESDRIAQLERDVARLRKGLAGFTGLALLLAPGAFRANSGRLITTSSGPIPSAPATS